MSSASGVLLAGLLVLTSLVGVSAAGPVVFPENLLPVDESHPIEVRDLWALDRISDPQPSPDGSQVAFVRKSYDVATNKSSSSLWIVPASGGKPRRLTAAQAKDSHPRWSPDGQQIAFLSNRSESSQIWIIDVRGGEARPVTELPLDVEHFRWSPDGTRFAFGAEVHRDCETLDCTAERKEKLEGEGVTARHYDHLLYRHWDQWDSGRRSHLFVVPVSGGTPVDLLQGADLDAPPKPFGGSSDYVWSPDGTGIAFAGRRREADMSWSTNLDLFVAVSDGSGYRCLTESNLATDSHPIYSPDGKTLAYLAMARPGFEADRYRIVLYDFKKKERKVLTEAWDLSPAELVWSPMGSRLYVVVLEKARRRLYAIKRSSGQATRIEVAGSATSLRVTKNRGGDQLFFLRQSLTEPAEVYSCTASGANLRRLTSIHKDHLASVRMSRPESIWFEGANGTQVHAWLHPPVDLESGKKYPLVLLVHGGPQGSWDDRFHHRWNPQVYAGAGYAVLAPDPHGSTGYGQAFTDAIREDWGGKTYEDLIRAVDHVVANVSYVDGERIGAAGGSYGGYMMNWIAGHTDRFRCLVNHAGLFDLRSFYGATEEQWFPEWEFGGAPWENPEAYERWSPSTYVDNWKTPMLVIHGAKDYRVPEAQGFATFTALQRLGIPSELLHFSDENHWVLKPQNAILWQDTILAWLDRWLKNEEPMAERRK